MNSIERAVLRTVLYADIFDFPLTPVEIHHFLIHDHPVTLDCIESTLSESASLRHCLIYEQGYIIRSGRDGLVEKRIAREQAARDLWPVAIHYARWLARLPFVRMVAITGALAVHNVTDHDDDLDYMVVTAPGRVWIARGFSILLVRLARWQGIELCPNYVVAESALEQQRKDLFIAHEIAQMVPVYGHELYWRFRQINAWANDHLPNAATMFHTEPEREVSGGWRITKRALEWLLNGRAGDMLEQWEYRRKLRRFATLQTPHSAAQIDPQQVKGHFNDYGHPVLGKYHQRLKEYDLEDMPLPTSGD